MKPDDLKRKLRELKRLETRLRGPADGGLVWSDYFSTSGGQAKYPLDALAGMDRERRKEVFEEYIWVVCYRRLQEAGAGPAGLHDPALLSLLGLPPSASDEDIRARFRELAKRHHPDVGGEHEKMIELLDTYHRLLGG
jgi:hypothetical protein